MKTEHFILATLLALSSGLAAADGGSDSGRYDVFAQTGWTLNQSFPSNGNAAPPADAPPSLPDDGTYWKQANATIDGILATEPKRGEEEYRKFAAQARKAIVDARAKYPKDEVKALEAEMRNLSGVVGGMKDHPDAFRTQISQIQTALMKGYASAKTEEAKRIIAARKTQQDADDAEALMLKNLGTGQSSDSSTQDSQVATLTKNLQDLQAELAALRERLTEAQSVQATVQSLPTSSLASTETTGTLPLSSLNEAPLTGAPAAAASSLNAQ